MTLEELEKRLNTTEAALQEMQKQVRATKDVEEIKQLQYSYLNAVMHTNWDEVEGYFAENATLDVMFPTPTKGKAEIGKFFREVLAQWHVGKEGDFIVHPIVTVQGDTAKGNFMTYFLYFYPRTHQLLFFVSGIYNNEYIRENGKWKINLMHWEEFLGLPDHMGHPTGLI